MKSLFLLALRNIFRNKRRTAITFMAIITGVTGIIVFGGFVEYSYWGLRESTIRSQLGHIQLYKKGYSEKGVADPGKYLISNPDDVGKEISLIPDVEMVAKRLTFSGLVSSGEKTLICNGIGIDPDSEKDMSGFEKIVDGVQITSENMDGGVVGVELMKALGANVGDYLTILTTTVDGVISALDFKVVGVAQTGQKEYDSVFIKLPIKFVWNLLNTNSAEKIIVLLKDTEDVNKATAILDDIIKEKELDIEYKIWRDLAVFYHQVVDLYTIIFSVMKVIIGLIVFFSIANTMIMSIFERVREIGTLRAIGVTKGGITQLFIIEGLLMGIIGGLVGIGVGILTAFIINLSGGINIPPPPGMTMGLTVEILIVPDVLLFSFLLTVIVAVFSSLYPAFKASRLKIVNALQYT